MLIFLVAFSLFNLCAAGAAWNMIRAVDTFYGKAGWASKRLHVITKASAGGLLMLSLWSTAAGWVFGTAGAPLILIPIAWLILSGAVFAIVDFAEDGVFDFGRGAPAPKA